MGGQDLTDIKTYGQLILHVYRCTHDRQTLRSFKNNLLILNICFEDVLLIMPSQVPQFALIFIFDIASFRHILVLMIEFVL